ncbi:MAG TPA: GEVED domain-containing protein [Bacteroidia bacterium]|jgi:hypothetical protein
MKKNLLAFFISSLSIAGAQNPVCIPPVGYDCVTQPNFIDSVVVTLATANFSNNGTDCNTQDNNYADYQNKIAREALGDSFRLHVRLNNSFPAYLGVWIDWNNDLVFSNGEQVYLSPGTLTVKNILVNVPANAASDTVIMRIRSMPVAGGPCDSVASGETEDYRLILYDATSVNGITLDDADWSIGPNPAKEQLHVALNYKNEIPVLVLDGSGRVVWSGRLKNGGVDIDASHFTAGIYFVKIQVNGKTSVKRFIHI